ncbi:hypothetical protein [Peribacillus sp. AS_2]|uniref:hypothetical protein n=1 Tax=Peribacillus sp. AS_2 TaxID=2996755 RepID=UPI0022A72428|nr:hypothetical protein [Peribacillus sp. AS_2]MCZ0871250.1 hypothetical protein [Peribacillus sp. AS_2]
MTEENKGGNNREVIISLAQLLFEAKGEIKGIWTSLQRRKLRKYYYLFSDIGRINDSIADSYKKGDFNFKHISEKKDIISQMIDEISNDKSLKKDINFFPELNEIKDGFEQLEHVQGIEAIEPLKKISIAKIKVMRNLIDLMEKREFTNELSQSNKDDYNNTVTKIKEALVLEAQLIRDGH